MRFTKYFHFLPILFVFLTGCQVSALVVANHKLGESSTLANQDESEENDKNWILQFLDKELDELLSKSIASATRLKWTDFRYNCNMFSRFKSNS